MNEIQVIAKNVIFPSAAPPAAALCDKADCRASRWELKNQLSLYSFKLFSSHPNHLKFAMNYEVNWYHDFEYLILDTG